MEWISVKDKLPENNEDLLYLWMDTRGYGHAGWFEAADPIWDEEAYFYRADSRQFTLDEVTHWMPFPEPPKNV